MAVAFVQKVANATGTTPVVLTLGTGITTTQGNTLIVYGRAASGARISGVTDSKGNTYTADVDGSVSAASCASIASGYLATALVAGDTITVTFSATGTNQEAAAIEFSGVAQTGRLDQTAHAHSATLAATACATSTATDSAGELAICAGAGSNVTAVWTLTAADPDSGGTWTALDYPSATYADDAAYQVLSGTTLTQCTWSPSAGANVDVVLATYRPAGSTAAVSGADSAAAAGGVPVKVGVGPPLTARAWITA